MTDDDPFDHFEDEDREGDPFTHLDDAPEGGPGTDDEEGERRGDEEFLAQSGDTEPTPRGAGSEHPSEDPFETLPSSDEDPFASGSVFERIDVGAVDTDALWASIGDGAAGDGMDEAGPLDGSQASGASAATGDEIDASTRGGDDTATVSKHAFCQQCEFFAEPPDAHCTHHEAEILEYLDMERVAVRSCPVVAQRREFE